MATIKDALLLAAVALMPASAGAAPPISFHADFEGGALGEVERVSDTHFRCRVEGERDQDGRNRQASWYYFRVDGAEGQPITIDLIDLAGEYNYRPTRGAITGDTLPWYSEDNRHWRPLATVEYDSAAPRLRLRLTPRTDRIWIAHVPPYTNRRLRALLTEFQQHPALSQDIVGSTVQGRKMRLLTITDPQVSASSKKSIWLMFRQHSWEAGSSWAAEGALRFLLSADPLAARMRRTAVFKIFPMCDPDGVARGGVRFNANGFDLNRNWDAVDEATMPEIAAQRRAVLAWIDAGRPVDLFLTLHNTETAEYLQGPPDREGRYDALARRLFEALSATGTFAPTAPLRSAEASTTPDKPGRMTVIQGLFHDRRVPAFLVEQMIAEHPKLGRQPTPADRQHFGADLVRAMWKSVVP